MGGEANVPSEEGRHLVVPEVRRPDLSAVVLEEVLLLLLERGQLVR